MSDLFRVEKPAGCVQFGSWHIAKGKGIEFKFKPIFSQREPTLATRHDYVRPHRGT